MRLIFGVVEEAEIADCRLFDAGDSANLKIAVAFDAAVQPFS